MIIQGSDYRFIPVSSSSSSFNVELLKTINTRTGEIKEEFENVAYGVTLEYAIQRVIRYRIYKKHKDQIITLQTYLDEYRQEVQNIKDYYNPS